MVQAIASTAMASAAGSTTRRPCDATDASAQAAETTAEEQDDASQEQLQAFAGVRPRARRVCAEILQSAAGSGDAWRTSAGAMSHCRLHPREARLRANTQASM